MSRLDPPSWSLTLFEDIAAGRKPSSKIFEDDTVFAFLDISPLSKGHCLVIPKKKYTFLDEVPDEVSASIGRVLPRIARAVMKATGAQHYNILQNNGSLAHQVVPHVHFHIIPKFTEDDGLGIRWPSGSLTDAESLQKAIIGHL